MYRSPLLLALLLLASPTAGQPNSPTRAHEPIVLEGHQLGALLGADVDRIAGYRFEGDGWIQIPVQVDERATLDVALAYAHGDLGLCTACIPSFFGVVEIPYWTDPGTWIGADSTDLAFDQDDELAFMARDAGGRRHATTADPPGVVPGSRVEVRLTAPEGGAPAYVYLFASDGAPASPGGYVSYTPVFCVRRPQHSASTPCTVIGAPYTEHYDLSGLGGGSGGYVGYRLGANPEDTWFEGDTYRLHFSDRWILDSLSLGASGPDLIDRVKLNTFNACGRTERTASLGRGAFIVNRVGPIRALRAVIGFNSAPLTQRHYVLYDRYFEERTFFRGHPVVNDRGKIAHTDYSEGALGMYYYSNLREEGVRIDGIPDALPAGALTWEAIRGRDGSAPGTILTRFEPHTEAVLCDGPCTTVSTTGHFEDSAVASPGQPVVQCTGDRVSLGAGGFRYLPTLPNTDPRPSIVAQHHELYVIELERRTVLSPENLPPPELSTLLDRLADPLTVTVDPTDALADAARAVPEGPASEAQLLPLRPNPAHGRTVVPLVLAADGWVRLVLYDVLGRAVLVLHDGPLPAGPHEVTLAPAALPTGTYLVRLSTPEGEQTRPLVLAGGRRP